MLAPIIVLGLGGVGSEIVARLERKVSTKKLKSNVLFAAMDTDVNTINKIQQEGFGGYIVQISKNMTVKEYLDNQPDYKEWFVSSEGLNIKSMTEGAGQVRAISRLAFDMAVRNGALNGLEERINQLFQISEEIVYQTPRILIVSSLAGGTGSGIVLPLALYMRKYFEETLHNRTVIIKGMFVMPDVFKDIIGSDFEQVSIEANAYAAIKELDAFIKKGEGYLSKRYSNKLKLKLPNKGSDMSEEYITLPYNYCYLFGGKNKSGYSLKNFQDYLNFIVECIYAQAFSPMQELNNSIEDNVFRIVSTGVGGKGKDGFQRFCSAGTAVLTYPYEEIVKMLALKKASAILSDQWLQIDKEYSRECQKIDELRGQGKYAKSRGKDNFYVEYVEEQRANSPFIRKIYTDTITEELQDEGEVLQKENWKEYWAALEDAVENWNDNNENIGKTKRTIQSMIKSYDNHLYHNSKKDITTLKNTYRALIKTSKDELEKKKNAVGNKFFGNRMEEWYDETYFMFWLKKNNNFIHPNAVRFFLYKTIEMFNEKREELKILISEESSTLEDSLDETSDKLRLSEYAFLNKLFYREEINKIKETLKKGLEVLTSYQTHVLMEQIAVKGCEVLERFAKEYEAFYNVFDYNVQQYVERAEDIKNHLHNVNGTITRYVCCDEKTLKYMEKATIDTRNDVEIDGEISKVIFNIILKSVNNLDETTDYHMIFQDILIKHWEKELQKNYKHILDLDILEAVDRERICISERESNAHVYINNKINKMWTLASPFIGMSDKQVELTKNFCTYSVLLEEKNDQVRNQIIQELRDSGGTIDVDGAIDKYTIVFYQVAYGLAPNSLKEMAIMWDAGKNDYCMGSVSKSYYQMLKNTKYSRMTPHIDWNWNRFDILPDFNTSYQEYLEDVTYQMFVYQCIEHLSTMKQDSNLPQYCLNISGQSFYEGTLHKMLIEHFINNLAQVNNWKKELKGKIQQLIYEGKSQESFPFFIKLKDWKEISGGIFKLIYDVNTDGGINEYDNIMLKNMVRAFINLLWEILIQFEMENTVKQKVGEIIQKQLVIYEGQKHKFNIIVNQDIQCALDDILTEKGIQLKNS